MSNSPKARERRSRRKRWTKTQRKNHSTSVEGRMRMNIERRKVQQKKISNSLFARLGRKEIQVMDP